MNHLLADTVTGVYEVETLDGEDCIVLDPDDFHQSLSSPFTGTIGTTVNAEQYHRIDQDYGIQFIQ